MATMVATVIKNDQPMLIRNGISTMVLSIALFHLLVFVCRVQPGFFSEYINGIVVKEDGKQKTKYQSYQCGSTGGTFPEKPRMNMANTPGLINPVYFWI